jgi:hypothetical protein
VTVWTRRDVLGSLGAAVVGIAVPEVRLSAAAPTFSSGAVIRTVLKDYPPDELGGGATLFHEHMSFAPDFFKRFDAATAATRAAAGLPPAPPAAPGLSDLSFMQDLDLMVEELGAARREGIGCIVDGGHPDMGRNIGFLRQLSMRAQMPIVAGAGLYTQPYYPKEISAMSEGPARSSAGQTSRIGSRRRVRRNRVLGRHDSGRAKSVPGHRPRAPGNEPADFHAHGNSWKGGARAARHS